MKSNANFHNKNKRSKSLSVEGGPLMKILADNESLGCRQNPLNTPHADCSPYYLITKLPGTRRSVHCFHVTSCLAYIVVKFATISHDS